LDGALGALGAEQGSLRVSIDEEREKAKVAREAYKKLEDGLKGLRGRREEATNRRMDLDRKVTAVKEELGRIKEQLEERYSIAAPGMLDRIDRVGFIVLEPDPGVRVEGLPEAAVATAKDLELIDDMRVTAATLEDEALVNAVHARLAEARTELGKLGEVNHVALQEYTALAEEHRVLDGQRADLDQSVSSIKQTVARLDRISRERFRETFDRVNACFQETYPRLVGGGKARLHLTDEGDILNSGVEIFVQPPGKRLTTLSLLSGGETAMVAIALIFSLFRIKPSPFCLLDEVDAPLDEGNGARFNSMLREMAAMSQFIVITHNKKTMEGADTLYGVTMPSPGVSRLVSAHID
jgi:chromosome segregation protein